MDGDGFSGGAPDHSAVKGLYATKAMKSMTSIQRCKDVQYRDMHVPSTTRKGDPDYGWRSKATTAFRNGVQDSRGQTFIRDAVTGTWFRDRPERRRNFHYTTSNLSMKFTEAGDEKPSASVGSFRETKTVWSAPMAGGFWTERNRDAPKSMIIASTGDLSHSAVSNQVEFVKSGSMPQLSRSVNSLRKQIDKA